MFNLYKILVLYNRFVVVVGGGGVVVVGGGVVIVGFASFPYDRTDRSCSVVTLTLIHPYTSLFLWASNTTVLK